MKNIIIGLISIITTNAMAITPEHEEQLKVKKEISYMDLAHENPFCPENSYCSKANGKKFEQWQKLTENLPEKNQYKKLEHIRNELGLPIQFLTNEKSKISIDPIIWNSRCEIHNPKDKKETIYKAIQFYRNDPKSEFVNLVPIKIHGEKELDFRIPYGEQPLFIWKNKLYLTSDYEDIFFSLAIDTNGQWEVVKLPQSLTEKASLTREDIKCEKKFKPNQYFSSSYCEKIWNEDTKTFSIIEQMWSCP